MSKDAIKKDVSINNQDKDENQDYVDPREAIVDSIVEKNDESRIAYEEELKGDDSQKDDDSQDQDKDSDEDLEESGQDDDQEEMVEIKVDGKKESVPLSQIVDAGTRTLQKESTADKRLEDATKLLKDAQKVIKSDDKNDITDIDDKGDLLSSAEITKAIQYGTEEEAEEAIKQLQAKGQSNEDTLTPDSVKSIVTKTVEETKHADGIYDKFGLDKEKGGFLDIKKDPYLMNMAISKVNELLEKGEANSWETYEKAGKDVREWVAGLSDKKNEESDFDKKKDRKKQTDTIRGATATKDSKDKNQKRETASDVIKEMADKRPAALG